MLPDNSVTCFTAFEGDLCRYVCLVSIAYTVSNHTTRWQFVFHHVSVTEACGGGARESAGTVALGTGSGVYIQNNLQGSGGLL